MDTFEVIIRKLPSSIGLTPGIGGGWCHTFTQIGAMCF